MEVTTIFPRGVDPDQLRRLQEHARALEDIQRHSHPLQEHAERMKDFQRYSQPLREFAERFRELERYHSPMQDFLRNENLRHRLEEAMQLHADRGTTNVMPPPDIQQTLQEAARVLDTPGFRTYAEDFRRANELAERQLSPDGLEAAQRIAARYLQDSQALELAVERIRGGQAAQILSEAAALAASPQVRETIRRLDEAELFRAEGGGAGFQNTEEGAPTADLDIGTENALLGLTQNELLEIRYYALQIMRILVTALSAAVVATNPTVEPQTLLAAAGGLYTLLEFLSAAITEQGGEKDE